MSDGSVPALNPRAGPRQGEKSGRRRWSLPGDWAAPPMLLAGPRRPSAQRVEVAAAQRGAGRTVAEQVSM